MSNEQNKHKREKKERITQPRETLEVLWVRVYNINRELDTKNKPKRHSISSIIKDPTRRLKVLFNHKLDMEKDSEVIERDHTGCRKEVSERNWSNKWEATFFI